MQYTQLGAYGNTVLPVHEIVLLAREALKSPSPHSKMVEVFYANTPHSGGKVDVLHVVFTREEGGILLGRIVDTGETIAFFVSEDSRSATFVTLRANSSQEQAS